MITFISFTTNVETATWLTRAVRMPAKKPEPVFELEVSNINTLNAVLEIMRDSKLVKNVSVVSKYHDRTVEVEYKVNGKDVAS